VKHVVLVYVNSSQGRNGKTTVKPVRSANACGSGLVGILTRASSADPVLRLSCCPKDRRLLLLLLCSRSTRIGKSRGGCTMIIPVRCFTCGKVS
jgi:hypothetical protein